MAELQLVQRNWYTGFPFVYLFIKRKSKRERVIERKR